MEFLKSFLVYVVLGLVLLFVFCQFFFFFASDFYFFRQIFIFFDSTKPVAGGADEGNLRVVELYCIFSIGGLIG